jgi:hypothetical protein
MAQFCTNCGEKVDPSWKACPKCGSPLEKEDYIQPTSQTYTQPLTQPQIQPAQPSYIQSYPPKTGTSSGTLALIFGIIGLCCCGFIFGILAIYYGNKGLKEGPDKGTAQIGLILGVIDIICGCIGFFVMIFLFY